MNFFDEILPGGVLAPAAASLALFCIARALMPVPYAERYAAPLSIAAGYCAGYLLLPSWAALFPERHWQWTFYLAIAAGAVGPIAAASALGAVERCVLMLLVALISGWLLVPAWSTLEPQRPVWVAVLSVYLFVLAALIEPLARRLDSATVWGCLLMTSAFVAVLIAAGVSVSHARVAGIASAALGGSAIASHIFGQLTYRGFALVYAVLVGGWAFIACIEPQKPLIGLLIGPAAPVVLWCSNLSALQGRSRLARALVRSGLVLIVLGVSAATVMVAGGGANTGDW